MSMSMSSSPAISASTTSVNVNVNVKPVYRCQQCPRQFERPEHLERHMRLHTGERPFKCILDNCDKRFSRYDNMLQHYRCHFERGHRRKSKLLREKEKLESLNLKRSNNPATSSSSSSSNQDQSHLKSELLLHHHHFNNRFNRTIIVHYPQPLPHQDSCNEGYQLQPCQQPQHSCNEPYLITMTTSNLPSSGSSSPQYYSPSGSPISPSFPSTPPISSSSSSSPSPLSSPQSWLPPPSIFPASTPPTTIQGILPAISLPPSLFTTSSTPTSISTSSSLIPRTPVSIPPISTTQGALPLFLEAISIFQPSFTPKPPKPQIRFGIDESYLKMLRPVIH